MDGIQGCGSAILGPVLAHVHAKTWELRDKLHYTVQHDQLFTSTALRITTVLTTEFLHIVRGVIIMPIAE